MNNIKDLINKNYDILSLHTINALNRAKINIYNILDLSLNDLINIRNIGSNGLKEIFSLINNVRKDLKKC